MPNTETLRDALKATADPRTRFDEPVRPNMRATPHHPRTEAIGRALGYALPDIGGAVQKIGTGRRLQPTDYALAALEGAGLPSAATTAGAAKTALRGAYTKAINAPVDAGRRKAFSEVGDRAGTAAAGATAAAVLGARTPTRWGKVPYDVRGTLELGLKASALPVDREINRQTIGRLIDYGLPKNPMNRRAALKGVGGLTAAGTMIPGVSPFGRALNVVENAATSRYGMRDLRTLRDAAAARVLYKAADKFESPVSRRDLLKGTGAAAMARAAGL